MPVDTARITFVAIDKSSGSAGYASKRIYAAVYRKKSNLYVSHDGGSTWAVVGNTPEYWPQRFVYTDNGFLYITYAKNIPIYDNGVLRIIKGEIQYRAIGEVKRYNTYSGEWKTITPNPNLPYYGISVSKQDPNKIIVSVYKAFSNLQEWGWGGYIYYSTDGGTTWTEKTNKNQKNNMDENGVPWIKGHSLHWIADVTIDPNNDNRVFATSGNGIFCCENIDAKPATWKFMAKGLEEVVLIDMISVPGGPLITSVMDQGGYVHTDLNTPPQRAISGSTGFACAGKKKGFVVRASYYDLLYSYNYGMDWNTAGITPDTLVNGSVAVSADGTTIIRRGTKKGKNLCYRTTNNGASWGTVNGLNFNCIPVGDPVNSSVFYAYNPTDGNLYVSNDGGKNFHIKKFVEKDGNARFSTVADAEGRIWIALDGKGLYYSYDGGATFEKKSSVALAKTVSVGKAAPGATYPAVYIWGKPTSTSRIGLYRSNDVGQTWTRINDDQHEYGGLGNAGMIEADMNVYGRVYMSTAGLGIPYIESASLRSASVDEDSATDDISLTKSEISAYPNPFTGGITVKAGNSTVKAIRILDQQGSVIRNHNVNIPKNETLQVGSDLIPGIYFLQITDQNSTKVIKAIKK